jgi:hypothetical protein
MSIPISRCSKLCDLCESLCSTPESLRLLFATDGQCFEHSTRAGHLERANSGCELCALVISDLPEWICSKPSRWSQKSRLTFGTLEAGFDGFNVYLDHWKSPYGLLKLHAFAELGMLCAHRVILKLQMRVLMPFRWPRVGVYESPFSAWSSEWLCTRAGTKENLYMLQSITGSWNLP